MEMKNLRQISIIFIKKSKVLTISCIISVCTAVVLIISMCNFALNAKNSYSQSLRAEYGDCDILATYEDYKDIPQAKIDLIKDVNFVKKLATGRTSDQLTIEGNNIYAIGVHDSDMMRSRYHYSAPLADNEIIINNILADILHYKVGDEIKISGNSIRVNEIIGDDTMSASSILMAVMTQRTLALLTGEKDESNFIMIKGKDNVSISNLVDKIQKVDPKIDLQVIEADPLFKDSVESFSVFVVVLAVSVMIVAVLFVASIFKSFLYKYNHDMAIIRALGGKPAQIRHIFGIISISLNGIACILGCMIAILLNKIILHKLNNKISLINSSIKFYFIFSAGVTLAIFLLIIFMLGISMRNNIKVLPITAISQNELSKIGKLKKRKKKSNIFIISKLFGKDFYIGVKMISTKLKENLLITLTITMIVVLSFVGASLSSIIQHNNGNYIKNEYLTKLVVSNSSHISYEDTQKIYEKLKSVNGIQAALVLNNGNNITIEKQKISYQMADLEAMEQQGIFHNSTKEINRLVLSEEIAKKIGVTEGSVIKLNTPGVYHYGENGVRNLIKDSEEQKFYVSAILPSEKLLNRDVYIDIRNNAFLQDYMGMSRIYISGDLELAKDVLNDIKIKYPNIKWSNYDEVAAISEKAINERFRLFEIVVGVLVVVAGLGWFNSIRTIILSRRREYSILRIQGLSIKRLRKIIVIQILIYLFLGIIGGIILGSLVLLALMYREQNSFDLIINIKTTVSMIIFMLLLSVMLLPMVKRISEDRILKQ